MPRTCPDCHNTYDDDVLHCPEDGVSLTGGIADDLIGHTVGSYRVVKLLGKGVMGSVYMAEHPAIGSKVAIKFLHPQYSHDEKIVDRFFNEARASPRPAARAPARWPRQPPPAATSIRRPR